jgi:hypothetical protein
MSTVVLASLLEAASPATSPPSTWLVARAASTSVATGIPKSTASGTPCGRGSRRARTRVPVTLLG